MCEIEVVNQFKYLGSLVEACGVVAGELVVGLLRHLELLVVSEILFTASDLKLE